MRICGLGDNVVDRYPQRGLMYPGGNALNVAVHAARRGARAAYLGVTGSDEAGRHIRAVLATEGVGTERARIAEGPNAYATVHLDQEGNRVFGDYDPSVSFFTPNEADLRWLRGFDLVHTGDCSAMEGQLPRLAAVCPVSFDFSDRPWTYAEPLLPCVHSAVFSRPEADDAEAADLLARVRELGPELAVVTRGARGALLSYGDTTHHQPVAPVRATDTLGAGDSFTAALLVALHHGSTLADAAARAAAYAAEVCTRPGAFGHPLAPASSAPL
ncbi:PfkB family carbohydrate kinase [Streptomyces sp. MST-110588]|uniref:PfkB family carbohydrate kinase n=1 Tax=Streptomyces sp. MST-110588 TaxID=2833628 RepID=UPI001F5C4804|nr:PfkB family carbohydrate kinase [Streptomyces sp. MST-110588]UNO43288.1 carbohydrate kinase [Streptomyces sp. MST-110588]